MILVRHGESHFNATFSLTRKDPGIVDPGLTETGRRQAQAAAEELCRHDIRCLLASPYTRTLQTAEIIAERLGLDVAIEPLVRERAAFVCDVGSPRSRLALRWPAFDFGELPERWWPDPEELEEELLERCARFRASVSLRPDWRHVAVVSHWGFIRALTGQAVANGTLVAFDLEAALEA